jgi:prepilin-type processing-associated H-X9-DG protein
MIGESNAASLDGGQIVGDSLFMMKDYKLGQRTGTVGYEAFRRHAQPGFNVGYLDAHVEFYDYPELTWYRVLVWDLVEY